MRIVLKLPDKILAGTLVDSPAARDFATLLPLALTLEDYAATEKIGDLPRQLTREGASKGITPIAGDIAYYAPWGNLALFHKSFRFSEGLILLGRIDGDSGILAKPGPTQVTIELVEDE